MSSLLTTLQQRLQRSFTIAAWLPEYSSEDLKSDVTAGLTVGVMLIPQSMAYALLAGLPPIYGLYAAVIPLFIYPVFGTSRQLAVGTVAIDMLIIASGLTALAEKGSGQYIQMAILLAFVVGAMQILMGAAHLGFLVNLLSRPVITGFTSAAALIIGFSQLEHLLGIPLAQSQYIHVLAWQAANHISEVSFLALVFGLLSIAMLIGLRRWKPLFPAPLAVVALSTAAAWGLRLDRFNLKIVGAIPGGLPMPAMPSVDLASVRSLLPTALTLALVQFMTVISLGKVFAARRRYSIRPNRELLAIGAANLAGSLFRSIPVSGSFSRTAVNDLAGARTPLANVAAALLIALTLLFFTRLFYYLPVSVFAAIIMVAAFGMVNLKEVRALFRIKRIDGALAMLTFIATLLMGIQEGILIGISASVIAVMYRNSRPNVAVLGHLPGTRSFRDLRRHREAEPIDGILMLRIDASFSFANAEFLKDFILEKSHRDEQNLRVVVIDAGSVNDLDTTAAAVLLSVADTLKERGIDLYFGGVKEPVFDIMNRSGLTDTLGADHFFLSPHRAVKHVLIQWGRPEKYLDSVPGSEEVSSREEG